MSADSNSPLKIALERLTIPELWRLLKLAGAPKRSCRSPFRGDDRHPSFSIYDSGRRWKDHGTGESGDGADFGAKACGLSAEGGAQKLIELAGTKRAAGRKSKPDGPRAYDPFTDEKKSRSLANWPAFDAPAPEEIGTIAELRGLSPEGVTLAAAAGLLWCCDSPEGRAWIITDNRRINAQARRMDGRGWIAKGGAKSWTLPGSIAPWPIGIREARAFPAIALVEGGPDLLAACHLAWCANRQKDVAPVAILGAAMAIPAPALPFFAGKRVRIFAHRDESGLKAERQWWRQLTQGGAQVDRYNFTGFITTDGQAVADLNDFAHVCPDQWETERAAIEEAFLIPAQT